MEPVNEIVINSLELEVENVRIVGENGTKIDACSVEINLRDEQILLKFPEMLEAGQHVLHLEFKGVILNKMKGFYSSKYIRYEY